MDNILVESVHHKATLITSSHKPLSMMEGISAQFDGVICIVYHLPANTNKGMLDDKYSGKIVELIVLMEKFRGEWIKHVARSGI